MEVDAVVPAWATARFPTAVETAKRQAMAADRTDEVDGSTRGRLEDLGYL